MDIVFLRGLRIETVIGIYDWEKKIKQPVILDLEMGSDVAKAAATDRIEDALNYKDISKRLKQFVSESRFELVETLAERCAAIIREEFGVGWVRPNTEIRMPNSARIRVYKLKNNTQIVFPSPCC